MSVSEDNENLRHASGGGPGLGDKVGDNNYSFRHSCVSTNGLLLLNNLNPTTLQMLAAAVLAHALQPGNKVRPV